MRKETEALAITVRDVWAPKYGSRLKDAGRRGARLTKINYLSLQPRIK
jgi:hypothetical protein